MKNGLVKKAGNGDVSKKPDYIFYKFDTLKPGKNFIIKEKEDPHPLYSQLLREKGNTFYWEYLEVGPKKWTVKISKRDKNLQMEPLGRMAASDHRKALVLRNYGLDYTFHGKQTLAEACATKGISSRNIERELNASDQQSLVYTIDYARWEAGYLSDFMVTNHHDYARKTLSSIADSLSVLPASILSQHPSLEKVRELTGQLITSMNRLMLLEEQVIFPYIRFLVTGARGQVHAATTPLVTILKHLENIEQEQEIVYQLMQAIRKHTFDFTQPHLEYSPVADILQAFNEFDNDLQQHIHVENNILYPKAIELEKQYIVHSQRYSISEGQVNTPPDHLSSLL